MFMEIIGIGHKKASFTVEAVFVMTITVWILLSLCDLALYMHDKTVLCTITHDFMERETGHGEKRGTSELSSCLKEELETHLLISEIKTVNIKQRFLELRAEVRFRITAHLPFVRDLYNGNGWKTVEISHQTLSAPEYMWDSQMAEGVIKGWK